MTQYPTDLLRPAEEEDDRAVRQLEEEPASEAAFWRSPEWHALAQWAAERY